MGVSVTASALIFFISFAICLQTVFVATQTYYEDIQEAQSVNADNAQISLQTALTLDTAVYNSTTKILILNATNSGSQTIRTDLMDILVDGELKTGNISKIESRGVLGGLLYPATSIRITLTGIASPTRVKLSTHNGVSCYTSDITTG